MQKEVIQATLASDYAVEATFREPTPLHVERPIGVGEAAEVLRAKTKTNVHDRDEQRCRARRELSHLTVEVLSANYRLGGTNGEVIRRLLSAAEQFGILEPRPRFEPDPALLRRNELARLLLDVELDRTPDSETQTLIDLLRHDLKASAGG